MKTLFKESIYGWISEKHGEVDLTKLEDGNRAFDPKNDRGRTGDDVIYVFGQDLPRTGFR